MRQTEPPSKRRGMSSASLSCCFSTVFVLRRRQRLAERRPETRMVASFRSCSLVNHSDGSCIFLGRPDGCDAVSGGLPIPKPSGFGAPMFMGLRSLSGWDAHARSDPAAFCRSLRAGTDVAKGRACLRSNSRSLVIPFLIRASWSSILVAFARINGICQCLRAMGS